MKKLVLATLLIGLTACGDPGLPRDVPLNVVAVTMPSTLTPGADLTVNVKYGVPCHAENDRLLLVDRTASTLKLAAVTTEKAAQAVCPAIYTEATLTYVDSGKVNRNTPFEVIVNGKSWGKIEIK